MENVKKTNLSDGVSLKNIAIAFIIAFAASMPFDGAGEIAKAVCGIIMAVFMMCLEIMDRQKKILKAIQESKTEKELP